jgi:hypothetical protein
VLLLLLLLLYWGSRTSAGSPFLLARNQQLSPLAIRTGYVYGLPRQSNYRKESNV